ncbi:MAG TPA: methionine synthase [Candidatus Angelobacter sp.]|nr:methionine synthase [Candidatus Angelobacter sp.]
MDSREFRRQALSDALEERILVLDGSMGALLQKRCTIEDFGGPKYENSPESVLLHRPDIIEGVHRSYLEAGADIIETDTFNACRVALADFDLVSRTTEINLKAAALARKVADEFSTAKKPRFVAGSIGPTTKAISVSGGITFPELRDSYYEQAKALWEGGVDILLVETANDTRAVKSAILAVDRLSKEVGTRIPLMLSGTIEPTGTMLAGQRIDAFWTSIAHAEPLSVGLNCGTGPDFMTDHLRTLHQMAHTRISCYPNAGLPNEKMEFNETPESLSAQLHKFIEHGWLNFVGGCCGTTPAHIEAIAKIAADARPRPIPARQHRAYFSGIEMVEAEESNRPLLVCERTNVIGSRAFKNLVNAEKWEEASEIARKQINNGAQIVDVCLQQSERDEVLDIPHFYEKVIRRVFAPFMIDTTDPKAIELALTYCQGKSLINSINLEDGEEKFENVCPIARSYGAALIVGCIDEDKVQAQAFTRERKLEIARRSCDLLTGKYGIPIEDILLDPLVFPCASGDENYVGGAVETIEGLRLIKASIPHVKTVLGISNISFGLPAAAREVVNSVFLYHCTRAGLDLAIVNAEKLERFASLDPRELELAESLLFNTPPNNVPESHPQRELLVSAPRDWREQSRAQKTAINQYHIAAVAEHFRGAVREKKKSQELSLDERLANYIIEGSKDGLVKDLEEKRALGFAPLDIVNGPLMDGMNEVGRLFNNNELIVAEVLQSAEAMRAAVSHLEQFMEKSETSARGRILLATVKGDVHDIGKNLVEIILQNNGYEVVNLGIKVPPEDLIRAYHERKPDVIGLSGLLVKSAQQMVNTANDFREAGLQVPLLVGGAALNAKYTNGQIGPAYKAPTFYCKDAMTGLETMNRIMDPAIREKVLAEHIFSDGEQAAAMPLPHAPGVVTRRSAKVRTEVDSPKTPGCDRRVRRLPDLREVWSYINPHMLYGQHLGCKGFEKRLAERDPVAMQLAQDVEEAQADAQNWMAVRAVWQFFEAERDGNSVHIFEPGGGEPLQTFLFGRQPKSEGLCLSDYILSDVQGRRDSVGVFVVTAGEGVREHSEKAKQEGRYLRSHTLQALAIETAEAAAEYVHRRMREEWGFPDPQEMTMQQRFTNRYRGARYSFGYPACPNLDDQKGVWNLLRPDEIGVQLTEGMMMEPEASVSALVFHHPDCTYFSVTAKDEPAN